MTFVSKALGDANFFKDVRQSMASTGEWLFAGQDGDLKYVVMDSLFFSLITVLRPDGLYFPQQISNAMSFTAYAKTLTGAATVPRVRVVVNGTFYDDSDYHMFGPGEARGWVGQVIQAGKLITSPPPLPGASYMGINYFIGRNGQRVGRYHCEHMAPWDYGTPNDPSSMLTYAMGGLLRLIQEKTIPPELDLTAAKAMGKTIVGYHKLTESLFVVSQEQAIISDSFGVKLSVVADRLKIAGADIALQCDGSSSSALIVDGTTYVDCWFPKDYTTPHGLAFQFANVKLGGQNSALSVNGGPQSIPNFNGLIAATAGTPTGGKLTLKVISFGSSQTQTTSQIANSLSIPIAAFPLTLEAVAPDNIDLLKGVAFKSAFGSPLTTVQCDAKLHQQADIDAIVGTVKVQCGSTIKTGNFSWPILV